MEAMDRACSRCGFPAIAVIPMLYGSPRREIDVCERHFRRAVNELFYVVRDDETSQQADTRFNQLVDAKHKRLRAA